METERYRVCVDRTRVDAYEHFYGKGSRFSEETWNRATCTPSHGQASRCRSFAGRWISVAAPALDARGRVVGSAARCDVAISVAGATAQGIRRGLARRTSYWTSSVARIPFDRRKRFRRTVRNG
jgi:hypothetical protein